MPQQVDNRPPAAVELTDEQKVKLLPWTVAHQTTNAVFSIYTVFGSVFILFLDELGLDKVRIGLLLSLLPFTGLISPFIAPAVGRWGLKRTFITFWATRKCVMALLVAVPWVLWQFGQQVTFNFVCAIVLGFALCRAIAETAWYPWAQEIVPNTIRGRFTAINNIVMTMAMILAILAGSFVIGHWHSLARFQVIVGVGIAFGVVAVLTARKIPGGGPVSAGNDIHWSAMRAALRDRPFMLYLAGLGLMLLGSGPLGVFIPLYAKEQLGLGSGAVVLLDGAWMAGGLITSYLWGWAADRYGSKPVAVLGLAMMSAVAVVWLICPRGSGWSSPAALATSLFSGAASAAWAIGGARLLYVSIVPAASKTPYMSMYYAWMGLTGGIGPLLAGAVLETLRHAGPAWPGWLSADPYVPVLIGCFVLIAAGAAVVRAIGNGRSA